MQATGAGHEDMKHECLEVMTVTTTTGHAMLHAQMADTFQIQMPAHMIRKMRIHTRAHMIRSHNLIRIHNRSCRSSHSTDHNKNCLQHRPSLFLARLRPNPIRPSHYSSPSLCSSPSLRPSLRRPNPSPAFQAGRSQLSQTDYLQSLRPC